MVVQRISLNNGDFDDAARDRCRKGKLNHAGATLIMPAMTNLAIQTAGAAYCRTALQRPMQPSVRVNRPDALLPEKCPVQVPLTPLAEAVPFAEPFGLTSPLELGWLKCPLVTVKDVLTTTSHTFSPTITSAHVPSNGLAPGDAASAAIPLAANRQTAKTKAFTKHLSVFSPMARLLKRATFKLLSFCGDKYCDRSNKKSNQRSGVINVRFAMSALRLFLPPIATKPRTFKHFGFGQ